MTLKNKIKGVRSKYKGSESEVSPDKRGQIKIKYEKKSELISFLNQ
jgi:hypothetical protein